MKDWLCRDYIMEAYRQEVCMLEAKFDRLELTHILCRNNEATDALAKMGSSQDTVLPRVFL
jgi:hypothetical protein